MGPFEKHVFVCTTGKTCTGGTDALAVHARLKELCANAGKAYSIPFGWIWPRQLKFDN